MPENNTALLEPEVTTEVENIVPETEMPEEELELVLEDLVFEEITIDGICGVYQKGVGNEQL